MHIGCPICYDKKKLLDWEKGTSIFQCNNCKLIYSNPLPTNKELVDFYQGFLWAKPIKNKIRKEIINKKIELTKLFNLDIVDRVEGSNHPTFLDYGGGVGISTKAMQELGFDSYYSDIDKKSIAYIKETLSIDEQHILNPSRLSEKMFDAILADNVIEHELNPAELISKLYNSLNKNGILIFKTPQARNVETLFFPAISIGVYFIRFLKNNSIKNSLIGYKNRYWHCDPPRHLYSFSKESMVQLLNRLHIENYNINNYSSPSFQYSITKYIFSKPKNSKGVFIKIIIFPLIPLETILGLVHFILIKLNMISSIGITIKINK